MTREAVARLCLIAGVLHLSGSMPEAQTAAGVPPRTASNATIRARVLGASDGRPVRGATVRLEDLGAVTDDSGTFELRRLSREIIRSALPKAGSSRGARRWKPFAEARRHSRSCAWCAAPSSAASCTFSGVVPGAYTLDVFVRGEQMRSEVASVPLVVGERPPARLALTTSAGPSLKGEIRAAR